MKDIMDNHQLKLTGIMANHHPRLIVKDTMDDHFFSGPGNNDHAFWRLPKPHAVRLSQWGVCRFNSKSVRWWQLATHEAHQFRLLWESKTITAEGCGARGEPILGIVVANQLGNGTLIQAPLQQIGNKNGQLHFKQPVEKDLQPMITVC